MRGDAFSPVRVKGLDGFPSDLLAEADCIGRFKSLRWKHGPICPYCGGQEIWGLSRPKQQRCIRCRRTFSFKIGSIVQGSPIPLRRWFQAIWLSTECDKGVTSSELARELAISQNSAWRMLRQLRLAVDTASFWCERAKDADAIEARIAWQLAYGTRRHRNEKRFKLELNFDQALECFVAVDRQELLAAPQRKRF